MKIVRRGDGYKNRVVDPATIAHRTPTATGQARLALGLRSQERVRRNGGRLRKPMLVALTRKLLVALWKYALAGVVIEGAILTQA